MTTKHLFFAKGWVLPKKNWRKIRENHWKFDKTLRGFFAATLDKNRREGKGRRCCLGDSTTVAILYQDDLKKRKNKKNSYLADDHPVHTTPNHHHIKMDVLSQTFVQIILAAKWFMRNSSKSPNQPRRPLPSLLSLFFFYGVGTWNLFNFLCGCHRGRAAASHSSGSQDVVFTRLYKEKTQMVLKLKILVRVLAKCSKWKNFFSMMTLNNLTI